MRSHPDVIIIGAGVAGLAAAKALEEYGRTFVVLETSHRIGGRAYSEEIAPGDWFDLGCAWVGTGEPNPFIAVADALGMVLGKDTTEKFKDKNLGYYRDGVALTENQRAACLGYYADCYEAVANTARQGDDIAISEVIDLDHEFAPPLLCAIASAWGMDVDEVSTADLASATGELGYPVLHGYGNLVAKWGGNVEVSLNTRAEKVDWTGKAVKVETNRGTLTGRTLLVTVSTGVLGEILFQPHLPDWKTQAIHDLPMGTENKMGVHFDKDVFGSDGRGYYSTWNRDETAAKVHASVMGQNTASVFVGGRHALWLERQGRQACHDFAVDRIADIFGHEVRKHVVRSIVTAWSTEPCVRGSWACARPGAAHQRAQLARCVDERLFFAGEATVRGGQGTVHGAHKSGVRAAEEIETQLSGSS